MKTKIGDYSIDELIDIYHNREQLFDGDYLVGYEVLGLPSVVIYRFERLRGRMFNREVKYSLDTI